MASILPRLHPPEPLATTGDDARLVALAQADRAAFADLYRRHFAGIYGYCYRSLGSAERAEDAAQQVFAQALASLSRYREQGRLRSWLYAIAHHVIHTQQSAEPRAASLERIANVAYPGISPEEEAIGAFDRQRVMEAIANLPGDQRRVIELRMAGLKGREIAEEMSRGHDAVRMLQHRALGRLAASLKNPDQPRGGDHGA